MLLMKKINSIINGLNHSPYLAGVAMLMLNIGSKYVELGFSKTQEQALRAGIARELLIFSLIFMATKDVIIAIIMTASFVILSDYLLNDKSRFCIMPEKLRKIALEVDRNNDQIISDKELEYALDVLRKAKKQKQHKQEASYLSYLK